MKENSLADVIYINVTYLHGAGTVLPPENAEHRLTIYHPDYSSLALMATVDEFLQWSKTRRTLPRRREQWSRSIHHTSPFRNPR